jgi:hypothetical protein
MAVGGQGQVPAAFPMEKTHVTHCTVGSAGPRTDVLACEEEKMFTPAGFEPRDVQPVAIRNYQPRYSCSPLKKYMHW